MEKILENLQKINDAAVFASVNYSTGYFIQENNKRLLADTIELVKNNVVKSNVIEPLKCDCALSGSCVYEQMILSSKEECRHKA